MGRRNVDSIFLNYYILFINALLLKLYICNLNQNHAQPLFSLRTLQYSDKPGLGRCTSARFLPVSALLAGHWCNLNRIGEA
jgi:hypothetical protein